MITLTPDRATLLEEVSQLEGGNPDLGGLVDEGARARLQRLRNGSADARAARLRLADRVRKRSLGQDADAADRVKRLGLDA